MTKSVEHCSTVVTDKDMNVRIFKTPTQPVLPRIYYNSGGDKEYILGCSLENKPIIGMKFDSLEDGIVFYIKYANDKEGYVTNNKKAGKLVEGACLRKKTVNRVGCPAKIKFRFCSGGKYMVYFFHESHSNPFSTPITKQVNKYEVGLNFVHKKFIFDNSKLNIGAVMSYRIMKELCGGYIKGSKNDFKNFSRDLKVYISNADGAADPIGRRDFQLFGDSLSFDSAYDTNKYSLVFCPFTGVDNHKRCITFCAALLSKEDVESFVWLFQTFLKCMGREPSCIITDQDPAMGIAIQKVFTMTKHSVIEEFNLVDHEWFAYMFKIGIFGSLHIQGLVYGHEQDELNMLNKSEPQLLTQLHFEKHAAVVYNRAIFYDFQEECQATCFSCGVESCSSLYGDGVEFSVIVDDEKRKNFDVNFDLATYKCNCTCKMFESQGILCRHILFIMKGKSIREIPDLYILNRWRKEVLKKASARNAILDDASKYDKKKQLVSDVWSKIFICVSLSKQSEDDLSELIRTLFSFKEQMLTKNNPENATSLKEVKYANIQVLVGSNEVDVNILPPNQCLNKGSDRSSKRLKSAKEIASEEKSKRGKTCRTCGQSGVSHDSRNCPNK
ncbi:protein FAR-RED IMPAIRED RESPONSE 1-like [Chenopodium quinoa]|uniref:protein FAR-RED IMPAIRED RESPONSE 1-like n=1 Tax=Chenopodium quinoa TaxID=63459 RepID=UPI000B770A0D|nr:protein FAR-RED IMPAIRED RESPONSE 1-like [Chenopodium quinoa]